MCFQSFKLVQPVKVVQYASATICAIQYAF